MNIFTKQKISQAEDAKINSSKNTISYIKPYNELKNRCKFQIDFSCFLLGSFFVLQYSVPISLVLLGSVATSKEQIALFLESPAPIDLANQPMAQPTKDKEPERSSKQTFNKESEILVSKIIFLLGIVTILLGVINNTIRPSESYDTCSNFNNKLHEFNIKLTLELLRFQEQQLNKDTSSNSDKNEDIYTFLIEKNEELCTLIDDFNKARSLSPRQANMKALNEINTKKELNDADASTDSLPRKLNSSSKLSNVSTDNSLAAQLNKPRA